MSDDLSKQGIWFVYDGECPLCKSAALALSIKKEYGTLYLVNAREAADHPLIDQINRKELDLDEGMVIYDGQTFYHGKSALMFMARYGDNKGVFNILNKGLFQSKAVAALTYPWMRGVRNVLLLQKKVGRIDNLKLKEEPIFKSIFGAAWDELPPVMQKHYANRPYTKDKNTVEGMLDVMCAGPIKMFAPLFWLMGGVPPHTEQNVPVTVHFESDEHSKFFTFNRVFHFKTRKPYPFKSRMVQTNGNEVAEIMRFGIAWKMQYLWENGKVVLRHKGYALAVAGHMIPLPLTVLLGAGHAEETPVDEDKFDMFVTITHPWWGKIYEYRGRFEVMEK